eukprot:NODE_59_length_25653_cov_0.289622.p13 type:complete len:199 gc:universal NODE_59_length_25653_cov_0.289622:21387-21983(+)
MDRYRKKVPELCILNDTEQIIKVPDHLQKQPLEELLYLVDTSKLNVVDKNTQQLAIIDFWCWCDQFISLKWFRCYSKLRNMGYKFHGQWFINPSKKNSFYVLPVDSNDELDLVREFASGKLSRPVNPFVNVPAMVVKMPNYQMAIQYFQSEIDNCEDALLLSIFDKDDTYMLSIEQINLVNDKKEKARAIMRRSAFIS